jgi:hypothetical protein
MLAAQEVNIFRPTRRRELRDDVLLAQKRLSAMSYHAGRFSRLRAEEERERRGDEDDDRDDPCRVGVGKHLGLACDKRGEEAGHPLSMRLLHQRHGRACQNHRLVPSARARSRPERWLVRPREAGRR